MQHIQGPEPEVLEPEVLDLEASLGKVDLVISQETQTKPASVCPWIQNQFWNQPGGEKL